MNLGFEEWGVGGGFGCESSAGFATGSAHAHQGDASIFHDGFHVSEIDIDKAGVNNDIADALDALAKDVIGGAESGGDRGVLFDDFENLVVRNEDEGIDLVSEFFEPLLCEFASARAFEVERFGDDADGEDAKSASEFGDDWCGSGSGSAAHSGGDENHVATIEDFVNGAFGFSGGICSSGRVSAGTEPASRDGSDGESCFSEARLQGLGIGVEGNESDAGDSGFDHSVHGVASASSHADHFDDGLGFKKVDRHHFIHPAIQLEHLRPFGLVG